MHPSYPADFVPTFPIYIDSSMRGDFVECPRKFADGYIFKRTLPGTNVHLTAGGAYAKGLEVVRTLVWGPEKLSLDDAIASAIPAIVAEYGDLRPTEDYKHKSVKNVITAIVAYFDRYPPGRDHLQPFIKENGYPAVEFTFAFPTGIPHPITKEPILYVGRFDMVGVYNDLLWVVDDKTASALGAGWDRSWRLRGQLTGYTFAAHQFGFKAAGAIVRGISFLRTGAFGFSEPIEYRSHWQLDRWWNQLHRDIARMVDCWNDKGEDGEYPFGYWDYNLAEACTAYGGCPFVDLCAVSNPDVWAETNYEYRDWNPLEKNPSGRKQIRSTFSS